MCYREVYLKQQRARAASQSREAALAGGSQNLRAEGKNSFSMYIEQVVRI